MLIIEGWLHFAPGEIDKFAEAARIMVEATLQEEGCLHYSFARDMANPDILRIAERWTDDAALDAHLTSPHMAAFGAGLAQVERIGADIRLYNGDEVRRIM
ncbi:MAG: putative quinol monooxygenase [Blastomonas fulva]|jgi:quinol monooxygenase YgiN|uniref:putative quinol monooxygenase n=1 Tax=Blastomonas TaxID=150203 RepID=UPI002586C5DD|nr:putative quinol monooxygenase [Blastomonas sp.]MCO5793705.1 antibiotic biosynthesis monooxygenase [Blastomonas sp.]